METYETLRQKARQRIQVADHMLTQTFPLINDPKLLVAVLENIYLAQEHALSALLAAQKDARAIPPFHNIIESKLNAFRMHVVGRQGFTLDDAHFIQDTRTLVTEHRKSPVEFSRKDKFVICSDDYKIHELTPAQLKTAVGRTKDFITRIERSTP